MPRPPASPKRTKSAVVRSASRKKSAAASCVCFRSAARSTAPFRPTIAHPSRPAKRDWVRYFLDTEYNGWGGALLSLALVPDEGEELYLTLDWDGTLEPWVQRHVVPYLDTVPPQHVSPRLSRSDAARSLAHYLAGDGDPLIIADWPEDLVLFIALLVTGRG